jgi:predicted nuclease of predicted toxin-antitoxin system
VKLLFDQNLSPSLVNRLADSYPGANHVSLVGLDRATDEEVWQFARDNSFTLVSKDADFSDLSLVRGSPPKVVWLRIGNCTTAQVESLLRTNKEAVEQMGNDPATSIVTLT